MTYRVSVVIEKDSHGYYAFSPEIEGCQTNGASLEDAIDRITRTIAQYLEPCVGESLPPGLRERPGHHKIPA